MWFTCYISHSYLLGVIAAKLHSDICQIWMWYNRINRWFHKGEMSLAKRLTELQKYPPHPPHPPTPDLHGACCAHNLFYVQMAENLTAWVKQWDISDGMQKINRKLFSNINFKVNTRFHINYIARKKKLQVRNWLIDATVIAVILC